MATRKASKGKQAPVAPSPAEMAAKCPMSMEELRKTFDLFDTDHGGTLQLSELKHACQGLGVKCTDNSAKKVFKMIDTDGSGEIDWLEFVGFFCKISDPDEMKNLLAAHNQRFSDYKFRVKSDPNILLEFVTPPSVPAAKVYNGHTNNVVSVCWLRGGKFASCSLDGSLMEWDVGDHSPATLKATNITPLCDKGLFCMDTVPDSNMLLIGMGCNTDNLALCSLADRRIVRHYEGHPKSVFCCSMSGSQKFAASGDQDGLLIVHDIERGSYVTQWSGHENVLTKCHFSKDERSICTASRDGHVKIFDVRQSDSAVATIEDAAASELVSCVLWCNETEVISCGGDYCIKRWDVRAPTMPPVSCYMGHTSCVTALTLSPDGQFIVSGANDGSVRMWELDGAAKKAEMLIKKCEGINEEVDELTRLLESKEEELFSGEGDPREIQELSQELVGLKAEQQQATEDLQKVGNSDTIKACLDLNDHKAFVAAIAWRSLGASKAQIISGGGDESIQFAEVDLTQWLA